MAWLCFNGGWWVRSDDKEEEMKAFFLTPLVIFLIVVFLFMAKMLETDNKKDSPIIGKDMPEFDLPAGVATDSSFNNNDLMGKYTLVNVFASWCIPCKIEHEQLLKIKEEGKLPIYGINWKDDTQIVEKWFEQKGNPYTKVGEDKEGKVIVKLGVTGAPETFLISPEGKILYRYAGVVNESIYKNEILPLVND
ncbi:MAG: DsbE family thiol:disulfide interchange protein [Rickettsiales bacterium]|nr:DsbE family thiol:disulfide interchange protein [Pseudomonadota bacterium]MDA0967384.1 DsbE family thiol:disulfide interchange protein [Pseudomonadota bacterium]MDG4544407.1 DsbE family thiol:disulfide interchange protein [Rickettsiales bacterium]MDG4546537.1 DsbE family thiol:disulfide interchange protein [Rickettsiales bacterium]MDG4548683.1 DsbE family thiol:disulfide interchange protein [Rickettsiales bacterium]